MGNSDAGISPRALKGVVTCVTGASRGIGRACAETLARQGAFVVGVGRDRAHLSSVSETILESGGEFVSEPFDLTEVELIDSWIGSISRRYGQIELLVNAAGVIDRTPDLSVDVATWRRVFATNVEAPFFLSRAVARGLMDLGRTGGIVNIGSLAGSRTTGTTAVYGASKSALIRMTGVLARRWGPAVRVNSVSPGYVRTDLNADWLDDAANLSYVISNTPSGQLVSTGDIADCVAFLASEAAGSITGQDFRIDGGWTA